MAFQYWQQAAERRPRARASCAWRTRTTVTRSARCRSAGSTCSTRMYRPLLFDSHPRARRATQRRSSSVLARARRRDRGGRRRAAGAGRGRHAAPAARLPARGARAVRPPRRVPDLRRGRDRLRAHRDDVRLRAGGRGAGLPVPGQGPHRRLPAARGDARDRARARRVPRRVTTSSAPSSTATPTPATRSPARRRSPRSTCSSRSGRSSGCSRRSTLLRQLLRDLVEPLHTWRRSGAAGFMCGIELAEPAPALRRALRMGHQVTLAARARGAIMRPLGRRRDPDAAAVDRGGVLEELVEITADSIERTASASSRRCVRSLSTVTAATHACLTLRRARSPSCARRRPGRTSRPGCPRTRCPARCPRRGLLRPGRR